MAKATKCRVCMKCASLDKALYLFEELTSGHYIPGRQSSEWWRNSVIRGTNSHAADILAPRLLRDSSHIQARVHKHPRGLRTDTAPLIHLQVRIGRWLGAVSISVMVALRSRLRAVEKGDLHPPPHRDHTYSVQGRVYFGEVPWDRSGMLFQAWRL